MDVASSAVLRRIKGVGAQAHGAVLWRQRVLCLDSGRGALVSVDTDSGQATRLWQVHSSQIICLHCRELGEQEAEVCACRANLNT